MNSDPYTLDRFVQAQDSVYERVLSELRQGSKRSHWMWFVFPQIAGLGSSPMAELYAITGLEEAKAYLAHPVLQPRLIECASLVNAVTGRAVRDILGYPDDLKFRSSMTLFLQADPQEAVFAAALRKYFNSEPDPMTLNLLGL